MSKAKPTTMTLRAKSTIYFVCFMASAFMYYNMEQDMETETSIESAELAKIDIDKLETPQIAELKPIQ